MCIDGKRVALSVLEDSKRIQSNTNLPNVRRYSRQCWTPVASESENNLIAPETDLLEKIIVILLSNSSMCDIRKRALGLEVERDSLSLG